MASITVLVLGFLVSVGILTSGNDVGPLPFFAVMALLFGFAILYQRYRVKVTKEWAARIGWTYVGSDPSLVGRWRGRPFDIGRSRRTSEVVTGTFQGRQAVSFVYRYTTGSGKNRSTTTHHVVAISLPAYLPTLELTNEGLGAKVAKTFGGQDLEFESEAFNRRWRVEARDAKFAHDVIHPRLMERLLRPDAVGLDLRIEGSDILCWKLGGSDLDAVAGRLAVMSAVADAVPRYIWLDHGHDPAVT